MIEGRAATVDVTEEEFVLRAIRNLRGRHRGIHTVFSGFNEAFRAYFGKDPVETTMRMAREGKIVVRPARGGAVLYLPDEAPAASVLGSVLERILGSGPGGGV